MDQTKIARALRALDYAVGVATLGYGVYTAQPLFIGGGIAGLVLAYLNLSDRISERLRRYFGRKTPQVAPPPPSLEVADNLLERAAAPQIANYGSNRLQVGQELFSQSRHSLFKSGSHLNHTQ